MVAEHGWIHWASTPNSPVWTPVPGDIRSGHLGTLFVPGRQSVVPDDERPQRAHPDRSAGDRSAAIPAVWSSGETFDWWKRMILDQSRCHRSSSVHHYVLKDTTVASGEWEGVRRGAGWTMARALPPLFRTKGRRRARRICTGLTASRIRPRSRTSWPASSGPGAAVARRAYPHPSRRRLRRQDPHRTALGHLVSQCRFAEPPPHADHHAAAQPTVDVHAGQPPRCGCSAICIPASTPRRGGTTRPNARSAWARSSSLPAVDEARHVSARPAWPGAWPQRPSRTRLV